MNDIKPLGGGIPLNRFPVFWAISLCGCAVDLFTKQWVFAWLGTPRASHEWWIWEPYVGIETAVNTGALFGMGPGYGRVFAVLSMAAAIGIICWLFFIGAAKDMWLTVALASVMGGILGNLYDRLGLWGQSHIHPAWRSAVRDWILLRYGQHTWPNFNIADSLLVCGAVMLMWNVLREHRSTTLAEDNSEN